MRVKLLTIGCHAEGGDHEIYLVVPVEVTAEMVIMSDPLGTDYPCLCECFAPEDAERIVELWNGRYGAH